MYSVIIPTIWRNLRIIELIEKYNDCPLVSEILLVDNMPDKKVEMPYYEKVKVIHSGENLYVNPSWNLGVEHAENEDVIISNDDISFDVNVTLDFMKDQEYGCAGVHPISINAEDEHPLEIYDGDYIGHGWGVLLFVDEYCMAAFYVGQYQLAYDNMSKFMESDTFKEVPKSEQERLKDNFKYYEEKVK